MNNIKESLYVGNIMQRTWFEEEVTGINKVRGNIKCWIKKENAILYKTKNGGYVDLDDLQKKSDCKKVDSVNISDTDEITKNGIIIMPAVALSDVENVTKSWGMDGTLGIFVDSESLISCQECKNNEDVTSVNKRHR